ncbi:MAG: heavy metal-associated domain-containing protein [Saprospiraceae bacterium]
MLTQNLFLPFFAILLFTAGLQAQSGMVKKTVKAAPPVTLKTETFSVLGNCGMCERTIEKAALGAGAVKAEWDMETDQLAVVFDPTQTSTDAIQKAVAQSGYDNAGYKAPDASYNNLHGCCKYDRSGAPGTAKACDTPDSQKN